MITLSMIVKNEEKHLANCLESVKDVVDEIVLVDTGSIDTTLAIAEKYSAKIFHFEWIHDFAAARNFALEKSTGDWILYLDADECLSKKSIQELKQLTKRKKREAYNCIVNNIDVTSNRPSVMIYPRLFANDRRLRFEGKVHEQIEFSLRRNNITIKNTKIEIDHYGYNLSKDDLKVKAKRNLSILLKQYETEKTSYYAFHLGQTYAILNEKEQAEKYFTEALCDEKFEKTYKSSAYRYLAIHNAERQNYQTAFELINKSLRCDAEQPLALLAASKIYFKLGDAAKAGAFSKSAFEVNRKYLRGEKSSSQNIMIDELTVCYNGLEIALLSKNQPLFNFFYKEYNALNKSAVAHELELFELLLNDNPIAKDKIATYANLITASNVEVVFALFEAYQWTDSKIELLQSSKERFSENSSFYNKYGLLLLETRNYSEAVTVFEQSMHTNGDDPSTIFYLVSAYYQNGETGKIFRLVADAEKKFASIEQVHSRLQLLKEKLPQIFF